jgi:hypothetical protein
MQDALGVAQGVVIRQDEETVRLLTREKPARSKYESGRPMS